MKSFFFFRILLLLCLTWGALAEGDAEGDEEKRTFSNVEWYSNDYYGMFGIPSNATRNEVKKAFRTLFLGGSFYPDDPRGKDPVYRRRMEELVSAYKVLGDPDTRVAYDEFLARLPARWRPKHGSERDLLCVWHVLVALCACVSVIQYFGSRFMADRVFKSSHYLAALKRAKAEGLPPPEVKVHGAAPLRVHETLIVTIGVAPLYLAETLWFVVKHAVLRVRLSGEDLLSVGAANLIRVPLLSFLERAKPEVASRMATVLKARGTPYIITAESVREAEAIINEYRGEAEKKSDEGNNPQGEKGEMKIEERS